jgi:hypothetical protein
MHSNLALPHKDQLFHSAPSNSPQPKTNLTITNPQNGGSLTICSNIIHSAPSTPLSLLAPTTDLRLSSYCPIPGQPFTTSPAKRRQALLQYKPIDLLSLSKSKVEYELLIYKSRTCVRDVLESTKRRICREYDAAKQERASKAVC